MNRIKTGSFPVRPFNLQTKMFLRSRNGYSFETALLLSIFLGMFGADRFYLGYPALGLLKFCTLGFMFLGSLIDLILIATQVVGPADGSAYVIPYYGAGISIIQSDNWTYRLPQGDWWNSKNLYKLIYVLLLSLLSWIQIINQFAMRAE